MHLSGQVEQCESPENIDLSTSLYGVPQIPFLGPS